MLQSFALMLHCCHFKGDASRKEYELNGMKWQKNIMLCQSRIGVLMRQQDHKQLRKNWKHR
jgi:hypothetical protein